MKTLAALIVLLFASVASAQQTFVAHGCPYETPHMRATWDRMKAENHPQYAQTVFNTTWDRYADIGRWEMMGGLMKRDPALLVKSFLELKRDTTNFATAHVGHMLGEMLADHAAQYACLKGAGVLAVAEDYELRTWLVKMGDHAIENHRVGDSDEDVGVYFGLAALDRFLGTNYLDGTFYDPNFSAADNPFPVGRLDDTRCLNNDGPSRKAADGTKRSLRAVVCHHFRVKAKGGVFPESSQYNPGTTWFGINGAFVVGLKHFPEIVEFIPGWAMDILFDLTPGMTDRKQWGDDEDPHNPGLFYRHGNIVSLAQAMTAAIGREDLAEALRQYELDVYAAHKGHAHLETDNPTVLRPLFARYVYHHDPYRAGRDWKAIAGNWLYASGQGHATWRTGTTAHDRMGHVYCPNFGNGAVDHFQAFKCGATILYDKNAWALAWPVHYAPDHRSHNHVLIANDIVPSLEATGMVGASFSEQQYAFASTITAGVAYPIGTGSYGIWPTYTSENGRYVFDDLSAPDTFTLVIDRRHAVDPRTIIAKTPWGDQTFKDNWGRAPYGARINAMVGLKDTLWQTPVRPTFAADQRAFSWSLADGRSVRVAQAWPLEAPRYQVDDQKALHCRNTNNALNCYGGYINDSEFMFTVHQVQPAGDTTPFDMTAHCVSAASHPTCVAARSTSGEPALAVQMDGRKTVIVSAKPGPVLATTMDAEGDNVTLDYTKLQRIVDGRALRSSFDIAVASGPVHIADLATDVSWRFEQHGQPLTFTRNDALVVGAATAGVLRVLANGAVPTPVPDPAPTPTPCTYTVTPLTLGAKETQSTLSFTVKPSATTCAKPPATSSAAWASVTLSNAVNGTYFGFVTVQANTGSARTATISVGPVMVTLKQAAAAVAPAPCVWGMTENTGTRIVLECKP